MAVLKILTFPDPLLREKTKPIEKFDGELKKLVNDMFDTMYDAPGVGLAANQVGILSRIFVLDCDYKIEGEEEEFRKVVGKNPRVMVNPVIINQEGNLIFKEGCLSVPGFSENVKRFEAVKLKFQDLKGNPQTLEAQGLLAVAIQHEMDHLEGKLFIDRLSEVKKGLIKKRAKKERDSKFERSRFHVEL